MSRAAATSSIAAAVAALEEERKRLAAELAQVDRALAALRECTGSPAPARAAKSNPRAATPAAKRSTRPGKLAAAEPRIRELLAAGASPDAIGQKVVCTGQAVRMLAKKRGWKRGAAPAPAKGAPAGPAPKVTVLPRGVSRRVEE